MKNFNEIYEKIYKEALTSNIEKNRKIYIQHRNNVLLATISTSLFLIFLLINVHKTVFVPVIIIIAFFVISILIGQKKLIYSQEYKEKIINALVKNYDKNLVYDPTQFIGDYRYRMAEFEDYDIFDANDYIHGKLNGTIPLQIQDIQVKAEEIDSEGHKRMATVFKGLFSAIQLPKNLNSTTKIMLDWGKFRKYLSSNILIQMDSSEFEKYFDVISTDKILAMRILTSDIMNYMINFIKETNIKFQITLKDDYMYLRIRCNNMFEASAYKTSFDFNTLYKYYSYLNFMCELNTKIYNTIYEKNL